MHSTTLLSLALALPLLTLATLPNSAKLHSVLRRTACDQSSLLSQCSSTDTTKCSNAICSACASLASIQTCCNSSTDSTTILTCIANLDSSSLTETAGAAASTLAASASAAVSSIEASATSAAASASAAATDAAGTGAGARMQVGALLGLVVPAVFVL